MTYTGRERPQAGIRVHAAAGGRGAGRRQGDRPGHALRHGGHLHGRGIHVLRHGARVSWRPLGGGPARGAGQALPARVVPGGHEAAGLAGEGCRRGARHVRHVARADGRGLLRLLPAAQPGGRTHAPVRGLGPLGVFGGEEGRGAHPQPGLLHPRQGRSARGRADGAPRGGFRAAADQLRGLGERDHRVARVLRGGTRPRAARGGDGAHQGRLAGEAARDGRRRAAYGECGRALGVVGAALRRVAARACSRCFRACRRPSRCARTWASCAASSR